MCRLLEPEFGERVTNKPGPRGGHPIPLGLGTKLSPRTLSTAPAHGWVRIVTILQLAADECQQGLPPASYLKALWATGCHRLVLGVNGVTFRGGLADIATCTPKAHSTGSPPGRSSEMGPCAGRRRNVGHRR